MGASRQSKRNRFLAALAACGHVGEKNDPEAVPRLDVGVLPVAHEQRFTLGDLASYGRRIEIETGQQFEPSRPALPPARKPDDDDQYD